MFRTLQVTKTLAQNFLHKSAIPNLAAIVPRRCMSLYEPDYLDKLRPQVPVYNCLNIEVSGYDFPILENYQKFVHGACETLDMNVTDSYGLPPKIETITKFKPNSSTVDATYTLKTFKRIVRVEQVKVHQLPLLIRIIQAALPEGVKFNVMEHTELHDKERYVPDRELLQLKQDLDVVGGPSDKKKKRQ